MKKVFSLVLMVCFMLACTMCSASTIDDGSLGGVRLGMSYQDVVAMYGEPTWKKVAIDSNGNNWGTYVEYGNTVQIHFTDSDETVDNVFVTADNGWRLSNGVSVGSKLQEVLSIYGNGTLKAKGRFGDYWTIKVHDDYYVTVSSQREPWGNRKDAQEIRDTDTISSLQISQGGFNHDFERNTKYVN